MTCAEVEPTPAELESISDACAKLWELDENRLEPGQDYLMNLQVRDTRRGMWKSGDDKRSIRPYISNNLTSVMRTCVASELYVLTTMTQLQMHKCTPFMFAYCTCLYVHGPYLGLRLQKNE